MPACSSPAASTCQTRDDDVEYGHDARNDGLQDGADAVDNGHQARPDGAEDSLNLEDKNTTVSKLIPHCRLPR
jgi:hypothetical protein